MIISENCSINRTYVRNIENNLSPENHIKVMLEDILDSKVKTKIAKLFVERKEPLYVSQVARLAGISKSSASECLKKLAEKGILESRVVGRSVVYSLTSSSLAKMVEKALTQDEALLEEIEKDFVKEVKDLKPISIALFGSALRGLKPGSDVDFLVIDGDREKAYQIVSKLTERAGLRISVLLMSKKEFTQKARSGEEFILNVLANHKLLYGKNLEDLVW